MRGRQTGSALVRDAEIDQRLLQIMDERHHIPFVVIPEVPLAVGGLIEVNALRLQELLVDTQVQRLGVGEHAIEVEHDCLNLFHIATVQRRLEAGSW